MGVLENFDQLSDYQSSACSSQSINDDVESDTTEMDSDQNEMDLTIIKPITDMTIKPSSSCKHLHEVSKLTYKNVDIDIFMDDTQTNEQTKPRFFFEPMVQLDPTTISIESSSDKLFKDKFVRVEILMWTEELRSKVLDRLRSLPKFSNNNSFTIQLDDISVMHYEEIQLVKRFDYIINDKSIRLAKKATSYELLSESVPFYFKCDSMDSARFLADNLRQHTNFLLEKCKLALECRGLAPTSGSNLSDRPKSTFVVYTLPRKTDSESKGNYCNSQSFFYFLIYNM